MSGEIPSWLLDQIDLVVISPGVPTNTIPARYVDRKDGEVIGEVELAYRFMKGRIVGITGSNGKTTTTTLIGELLRNAGIPDTGGRKHRNAAAELGGIVRVTMDGRSLSFRAFSWRRSRNFGPNVAICLNVTPNHLDRYESFTDYAAAKHRIFMNQTARDVAILNADNEITASWATGLESECRSFQRQA